MIPGAPLPCPALRRALGTAAIDTPAVRFARRVVATGTLTARQQAPLALSARGTLVAAPADQAVDP